LFEKKKAAAASKSYWNSTASITLPADAGIAWRGFRAPQRPGLKRLFPNTGLAHHLDANAGVQVSAQPANQLDFCFRLLGDLLVGPSLFLSSTWPFFLMRACFLRSARGIATSSLRFCLARADFLPFFINGLLGIGHQRLADDCPRVSGRCRRNLFYPG
jgi:hypothetical protein